MSARLVPIRSETPLTGKMPPGMQLPPSKPGLVNTGKIHTQLRVRKSCWPLSPKWLWPRCLPGLPTPDGDWKRRIRWHGLRTPGVKTRMRMTILIWKNMTTTRNLGMAVRCVAHLSTQVSNSSFRELHLNVFEICYSSYFGFVYGHVRLIWIKMTNNTQLFERSTSIIFTLLLWRLIIKSS